ncbi:MAG: AsmA family protein [Deltaproteobacteria bacterium]|nr:MAG: AsmA family protein [Deltaproteobacteria bacterium]
MKRVIKLVSLAGCGLLVVILAVLLTIPFFLDAQKYKPLIEKHLAKATRRPFQVGNDLRMSLFPSTMLSFSALQVGNPPEFKEENFITVKNFEARLKLFPFLFSRFKDIQIRRFILNGPQIALIKNADGQSNWKGISKSPDEASVASNITGKTSWQDSSSAALPFSDLAVDRFSITDGSILWIDHRKEVRYEISNLNMDLKDVSLVRPVRIALSATAAGQPLTVRGNVGPLGTAPGQATVPINLSITALQQLKMDIEGHMKDPVDKLRFDLSVKSSSFSVPKLADKMGQPFAMTPSDKTAFNRVAFSARLRGNLQRLAVTDGVLDIDETTINFSVKIDDFSKPDISFDCSVDQIDLNRYLPAKWYQKGSPSKSETTQKSNHKAPARRKTAYDILRQIALKGSIRTGKVRVSQVMIYNFEATASGKNGILHLAPVTLKFYGGDIAASGSVNFRKKIPNSHLRISASNVQLGPLLQDIWQKDLLEGTVNAQVMLRGTGDTAKRIGKTLNGSGEFRVNRGAIIGIDLVGMVRNIDGSYGFSKTGTQRPRTRFTKFQVPFSITRGVFYSNQTYLESDLVRVKAAGKADLVKEILDIRVDPAFAEISKAQASEIVVPVLISGSFGEPKFRPDVEGIVKKNLGKKIIESSKFKKIFKKEKYKPFEDTAKGLLKQLLEE